MTKPLFGRTGSQLRARRSLPDKYETRSREAVYPRAANEFAFRVLVIVSKCPSVICEFNPFLTGDVDVPNRGSTQRFEVVEKSV